MGNTVNNRPETAPRFITDTELRERGVPEIEIDRLNHKVETQLVSLNGRDRAAVEAALAERNQWANV